MVPGSIEAVVVLLLAIAPGYLVILTWARAKTWKGFGSDLDTVLRSLVASLLVQIPMFPLAIWAGIYPTDHLRQHASALFSWLLFTVVIVPGAGGWLASFIYDKFALPLIESNDPKKNKRFWAPLPPTPWDRFFIQKVPNNVWLVVELEDGFVAGSWEEGSFALTSPATHGLFLQEQWQVSEQGELLEDPVDPPTGVLIHDASKIKRIRVITPIEDEDTEQNG